MTLDIDAIEACIKNGAYHEMDLRAMCAEVRELRAALERAANDLMLSEKSFVQMRDKRDDVLRELQTKQAALDMWNRIADERAGYITRLSAELDEAKQVATGQAFRAEQFKAALEQARALASRWRDTLCLFPNLEALVDEIDALMAAAPGGAA